MATLRESSTLEVERERGEHFRLWMWTLFDPEIAICVLAMLIPSEITLLTAREKACLFSLAQGRSTRDIADELGIGLSTVHTHLRRAREKLQLASVEELIGFAAGYFYTPPPTGKADASPSRKRSG